MCFFPLQIGVGKPYREGGFIQWPCSPTGRTHSGLCWLESSSGGQGAPGRSKDRAVLPDPSFCLFQLNCSARAPSCLSTERGMIFSPSCIRKQSDLAVLVICLQLSWLRCTSQETNIFLINFPVTFYRCYKLHWSYPFSVHCGELWVCNRAQSILRSQFQKSATENCYLIIFI